MRSVRELTLSYRYVLLSLRSGGEELAQTLRRQYGISLLLNPSSEQLNRADALVLFSPRPDLLLENRVLCTLYPGADERGRIPLRLDPAFADTLPPNSSPDQLAAALYGAGTLPPERFLGEITC